jgi:hypothetical protein
MKPKAILGLVAIAAFTPVAWAGGQAAAQKKMTAGQPHARSAAQPAKKGSGNGLAIDSGTRVNARLLTTLNAKKAKPGQRVVAKVTQNVKQHGHILIRKNSRLIGHIVSAQASGKGNAGSRLEVAFDRLVQGRSSTALHAVVTSIISLRAPFAPQPMNMGAGQEPMEPPAAPMGGSGGGGGLAGGAVGGVGSAVGATMGSAGAMAHSTLGATGQMTAGAGRMSPGGMRMMQNPIIVTNNAAAAGNGSAGVTGALGGAQLGASGNASQQTGATSVFSRRNGNVELDSGTQLQFQVVGSAHANHPSPSSTHHR